MDSFWSRKSSYQKSLNWKQLLHLQPCLFRLFAWYVVDNDNNDTSSTWLHLMGTYDDDVTLVLYNSVLCSIGLYDVILEPFEVVQLIILSQLIVVKLLVVMVLWQWFFV